MSSLGWPSSKTDWHLTEKQSVSREEHTEKASKKVQTVQGESPTSQGISKVTKNHQRNGQTCSHFGKDPQEAPQSWTSFSEHR